MKNSSRLLVAAAFCAPLFFAACGGGSSSKDMAFAPDMTSTADASVSPDQSAVVGTKVCSDVLLCSLGCTGANKVSCVTACVQSGTTAAQSAFQALITCGYTHCVGKTFDGGTTDGGETGCATATDQTPGCQACVSAEAQSTDCSSEFSACINGK